MEILIADRWGRQVRTIGDEKIIPESALPRPLPPPDQGPMRDGATVLVPLRYWDVISGSEFARFEPRFTGTALVFVSTDTTGVLSLITKTIGRSQVNTTGQLRQGVPLTAGQWGEPIPVPVVADGVYELSFSVPARITVQVIGVAGLVLPSAPSAVNLAGSTIPTSQPVPTTLLGSILQEQQTQADASGGIVTFSGNIQYLGIFNTDPNNDGVFTVNGIAITVPAGGNWSGGVGGTSGDTVEVTGSTKYILSRNA